MKYPKIDTIWKRDETNKGKIIEGDFSKPEFNNIKNWLITEKINGTNIRITFDVDNNTIRYDGRTDDAQISSHMYKVLNELFTPLTLAKIVKTEEGKEPSHKIILYGEGYGAKIQKGGGSYRKSAGFILFDVWIDGWWLKREDVVDIANKLLIQYVPEIGIMSYEDAIKFVKSTPNSTVAEEPLVIEGIVATSHPLMLFRDGVPIKWKLKVKDFK